MDQESKINIRSPLLCTDVASFCFCLHKWGIAALRLVSVAQKFKTLIMMSSNVQSIDLPMDCMA